MQQQNADGEWLITARRCGTHRPFLNQIWLPFVRQTRLVQETPLPWVSTNVQSQCRLFRPPPNL